MYRLLCHIYRKPLVGGLSTKYIFITGCDSGFGRRAAVRLDGMGCHVIAGCLTETGENDLKKQCSNR